MVQGISSSTLAVGALIALAVTGGMLRWRRQKIATDHLRGRSLHSPREAETALERALPPGDRGLQLGRLRIPSEAANSHLAIVGATGSGKTLLQRLLMQSALSRIGDGCGHRALIYDPKQDMSSVLAGMQLKCPVHHLNPLDARSVAWDMAADIRSPAAALQVAAMLVPESRQDSNPFFNQAARHLIYGVLIAFIQSGKPWTFRQMLLLLRDAGRLQQQLERSESTRFLRQYFDHPATFQNILSTLLAQLSPFEVIAAAWDRARTSISLTRWMKDESILVLGNDEENRTAVEAVNRLIVRRITDLMLAQDELTHFGPGARRTWFFLDEIREAGRLEGLGRLLTKGRSKGAAVVLGFQDISGLHDVYGKEVAEELVGQCSTKAILRLNSPETAAWASRLFGSREVLESRLGHSRDFRNGLPALGPSGESISHGVVTRRVVLDSEFFDLPVTDFQHGLTGYFVTPVTGVFRDHLPGSWLRSYLSPVDPATPNLCPRPIAHQFLKPWSEMDEQSRSPRRELWSEEGFSATPSGDLEQ